ncbi:SDR family oxidoreductase [Pseudomonas sp. UYIF39]|nr:SDR family oxidoreductase [Pseudomonas sp. UYIF39]
MSSLPSADRSHALRRLAQPEDISRVVPFLVGPDSGWVNGQILRVNGGLV